MAIWRSIEPGFVDVPFAEYSHRLGAPEPGYERRRYVAIAAGSFVGLGWALLPMNGNLSHAYVSVRVAPEWRRRGFGRAIEAQIRAELPAQRTELHGCVEFFDGHASEGWLVAVARLGYTEVERSVLSALPLPVANDVLDSLAGPTPAGYRVESFQGAVPVAYQAGVGILDGLVNADASTGDAHVEPVPVHPEDYRAQVALLQAAGRDLLTSLALTDDERVVGYTVLQLPSDPRREVYQQGTLVLAEHRGHGLGLALKVANLRALQALDRGDPKVTTGNNDANRWMREINQRLGFQPSGSEVWFRRLVEAS